MESLQEEQSKTSFVQSPESSERQFASAPYNFVTLPDRIVASPLAQGMDSDTDDEIQEKYKEYVLTQGNLSGRLELTIETVTPCFIGGTEKGFYAPNGQPVIPGSTLRGMTKNLIKIISCGAMRGKDDEDFFNRHLYFREFVSNTGNLKKYYGERMVKNQEVPVRDEKGNIVKKDDDTVITKPKPRSKASAGFLFRMDGNYYVVPAMAHIKPDPKKCNNYENGGIDWHEETVDIFTGKMVTKKTYVYFEKPKFDISERIPVPNEVINEYKADKSRKGLNLLETNYSKEGNVAYDYTQLQGVDYVVPCYYSENNGQVVHFGHGRYYRIAYDKSIGDHIPAVMQSTSVDFADAMFGMKNRWAGRVYFDDAHLLGKPVFLTENYRRPLLQPNPTSFQLYLKQDKKQLMHWGEKAEIRGYKLYWHKAISDTEWQLDASDLDKFQNVTKQIQPLAKGNQFVGSIRFSNLSEVELGALCKVFCLAENGEDIVYKVGQGKPLGMGSVRIKTKLFLEDTKSCYNQLFKNDGWNMICKEQEQKKYCNAFETYIKQALGAKREWYETSMRELRTILDWNNTEQQDWRDKTAMMNPIETNDKRLKDRVVLKDALSFVKERFQK